MFFGGLAHFPRNKVIASLSNRYFFSFSGDGLIGSYFFASFLLVCSGTSGIFVVFLAFSLSVKSNFFICEIQFIWNAASKATFKGFLFVLEVVCCFPFAYCLCKTINKINLKYKLKISVDPGNWQF